MRREEAEQLAAVQAASYAVAGSAVTSSWPQTSALDAETLAAFLDEQPYCVLATTRPDGRPQARPVAFTVVEGALWIASVSGARLRNVTTQPYVSLVVSSGARGTHRMVLAEGPTSIHEREIVAVRLDPLWIERHGSAPDWAAAFIELRPERIFSYDAAAP